MASFVGYYRVSTRSQGESGLGLIAQKSAVDQYVRSVNGVILREFEEIESGSRVERPQFQAALQLCKAKRAVLAIAKLDRLARNVHLISALMESGIEFVAADMPTANRLTMHIVAAIAEHEKVMIATRTRDALRAARSRGVRLGNPHWRPAVKAATEAACRKADEFARKMHPILVQYGIRNTSCPCTVARLLNKYGHASRRGLAWTPPSARNLLQRMPRIELELAERLTG